MKKNSGGSILIIVAILALLCILVLSAVLIVRNRKKNSANNQAPSETVSVAEEDLSEKNFAAEPEPESEELSSEDIPSEEPDDSIEWSEPVLLNASTVGENSKVTYGIDVSKYQGTIDWATVAASGVEFAIIRVGYRGTSAGGFGEDEYAKRNLQEAEKNGVKMGVYFYGTAITEEEAREEADWVTGIISAYSITYPVAYDCEGFEKESHRQNVLTKEERSNIAMAFMDRIYENGYTPMIYGDYSALANDAKWVTSRIEKKYKVWVARYNQDTNDLESRPMYEGQCSMWQYSNHGRVSGIPAEVDLDVAYFGYDGTEAPKDASSREEVPADVTAEVPAGGQSQQKDSQPFKTKFTPCNENVTAKERVNLRSKPSFTDEDSLVLEVLEAGQIAVRTGINTDVGWSRVEYNGQVLYCISSYIYVVEQTEP